MDFITIPVVISIITYGIYKLFELFVCRRERLSIIEKLSDNQFLPAPDSFSLPNYAQPRTTYGTLKGGCLLLGVGLGLLIGFFICTTSIPHYFDAKHNWDTRETITIIYGSCVLIFGGIGLLTAFVIELMLGKKRE
ncbi:MAG: hypothetical protein LBF17_03300 [Mediterranea sp.]|jgi:hypothetical protein|nr:hypothetical protein [Mediterranea sp.]